MASVLDLLHPMAQPSMNGFDLSQKHVYGSVAGRFDAPLFVETVPADKFQIDIAALMRTMTLNTSAFLRGKVTFDFYFVPFSQIWHPFNQFVDQRLDAHSSLQKGTKYVPVIHLYDLLNLILLVYQNTDSTPGVTVPYYLKDIHNVPWYNNIWNLLDFFGYGNFLYLKDYIEDADNFDNDDWLALIDKYKGRYVNIFRPAAYQHIWYDYIRNKYFDNYEYEQGAFLPDYVKYFNFDDIQCDTFANSIIPIDTTTVNAAVNLRIFGLFSQRYVQYKQDLIQSVLPSQQFGVVSDVQVDIPSLEINGSTDSPDYIGNTSKVRKYPDDASVVGGNLVVLPGQNADTFVQDAEVGARVETAHTHSLADGTSTLASKGSYDVIALKRAEALQKWRQNVMRAGNMVDDNFRAHFGETPRYEADNNALKLGSFEGTLNVNTVETTAISSESGNNKVGDLGATATCVINGQKINFKCSDYGVIVCTQYFRPESEYSSTMIDRAVTLHEPFDFFTPEFCNLGLNPIQMLDYNFMDRNPDEILGFASQYWWYKQALDKCHGQFAKFVADSYVSGIGKARTLFKGNQVMWDAPRIIDMEAYLDGSVVRSKSSFYMSPNILDDVFGVNYFTRNTDEPSVYYSLVNQLIFNVYFDIKAIRPMTSVGLPNF